MNALHKSSIAMIIGVAIGASAVEAIYAQAKPPAYAITEIAITDLVAYQREYVPLAQAAIRAAGGRPLAGGQNIIAFEGTPPLTRVSINQFDGLEAVQKWRDSEQFKEARKVGDKYAKFRAYAVEGFP